MADMGEQFFRYITILQLIPPYPRYITTPELLHALHSRGIHITSRAIQRDLTERLSRYFPLMSDTQSKPYRWSIQPQAQLTIPAVASNPTCTCSCC